MSRLERFLFWFSDDKNETLTTRQFSKMMEIVARDEDKPSQKN